MDFTEFAKGIGFGKLKPNDPPFLLEIKNTSLIEKMEVDLAPICSMPRMSTYAIACLINKAVRRMPEDQCYVNVGVWHGFSLLAGMLGNPDKLCIGVDNFSEFGSPRLEFRKRYLAARSENHQFFELDWRQYFRSIHKLEDKIGFYFYDGAHDYKSQFDGLKVAEPFLADHALVMVDDCNWAEPDKATRDFMADSPNEWEIILDEKTACNMHPTWWNGLIVLQKGGLKDASA